MTDTPDTSPPQPSRWPSWSPAACAAVLVGWTAVLVAKESPAFIAAPVGVAAGAVCVLAWLMSRPREDGEVAWLTADVVALAVRDGVLYVLLVRCDSEPHEGCWALPGGYLNPGETIKAAARRELAEETGIDVTAEQLALVGVYSDPKRDPRGRVVSWAYAVRLDTMPEPTAGSDAREAKWVPVTEALAEGLAFDHGAILADAVEKTAVAEARP